MQYYFWLHCYVTVNIIRYSGYHRVEPLQNSYTLAKILHLSFLPSFLCYVYCCCMDYCFSPKYFIYFCCCLHLKIACRQHVSSIVPPFFLPSFLIIRYAVLFLPSFLPATLFLFIRRRLDIFDYIAMWQYCKYYTVGIIELNPYKSSTLWSP